MNHNAADEDYVFLEQVLEKLYDFEPTQSKKKKRKRCNEEETVSEREVCTNVEYNGSTEDLKVDKAADHPGASGRKVGEGVEVVTFQDPHKKVRIQRPAAPSKDPPKTEQKQNQPLEEVSLEKVRLEVHRFGITGFQKEQQRVFEQDRVVMLGARPPKKSYVNYKLLQEQMKEKKQQARQEVQLEPKKKKKKQRNQADKKVSSSSGAAPTGQVGRFKDGMLILSSKEIHKIKGQRGAK